MLEEDQFEVLISTMNRDSLDFIDIMFSKVKTIDFNILIINQTTPKKSLSSTNPKIRVVNSLEKGLSKSRNLALTNAKSKIVLISDDDLVYESNFKTIILEAYKRNPEAALISFESCDTDGKPMRQYPEHSIVHNFRSLTPISSREISVNLKMVRDLDIIFDEDFGLGSTFEIGEEQIFSRAILKHKTCLFEKQNIVQHPFETSGRNSGSDKLLFARAALFYNQRGEVVSYLKLFHYVYLILKSGDIGFGAVFYKLKMGLKGIKKYKAILKSRSNN
ncbi:glycosyltransferase [Olleya sp. R77988]|uniref:glycosyltransferase n=1 Tax=Olleya sp. R77988 TaxID=3093875 RepID=UPI0037CA8F26